MFLGTRGRKYLLTLCFQSFCVYSWKWNPVSYGNCMSNFGGMVMPFSTAAAPFNIHARSVQGLQFLHILTNSYLLFCFILITAILTIVRWYFNVDFHYPCDWWCRTLFHILRALFEKLISWFKCFQQYSEKCHQETKQNKKLNKTNHFAYTNFTKSDAFQLCVIRKFT